MNGSDAQPLLEDGLRNRKPTYRRHEPKPLESDEISNIREETGLKADLQGRMLMAMFELAKNSFENAHKHTHIRNSWWFAKLPEPLQGLIIKKDAANFYDFAKAYDLIHDWYPRLETEVRTSLETWETCKRHALVSMKALLEDGHIGNDSVDKNDFFKKWIEQVLRKDKNQLEGFDIQPEAPHEQYCTRHDLRIDHVRQNLQTMHALLCGSHATTIGVGLKTFLPVFRVAWLILMLAVWFLYESCILGLLTQLVFKLNVAMSVEEETSGIQFFFKILYLGFLPFYVLLYALFGAEMGELVHDSMQYPAFKRARASLIIMLSQLQSKSVLQGTLHQFTLFAIDVFLTQVLGYFVMVFPVVYATYRKLIAHKELWLDVFLNSFFSGALTWAFLLVFFFAFARLFNNIFLVLWVDDSFSKIEDNVLMRCVKKCRGKAIDVVFRPARCNQVLRRAMGEYEIPPGQTWKYFVPLQRFLEIYRNDDHAWHKKIPEWYKGETQDSLHPVGYDDTFIKKVVKQDPVLKTSSGSLGILWCLVPSCVWLVTVIICYSLNVSDPSYNYDADNADSPYGLYTVLIIGNVGMLLTLVGIAYATKLTIPLFADNNLFRAHLLFFVICMILFSCVSGYQKITGTTAHPLLSVTRTDNGDVFYNDGDQEEFASPYPVCSMHWGSRAHRVRILDMTAMSWYAYENNKSNFDKLLKRSFANATTAYFDEKNRIPRVVAGRLCGRPDSDKNEQCTLVVAVRGTSSKLELMSDLGIFATVAVMQALDKIAPIGGTLPVQVIGTVFDWFRFPFLRMTQEELLGRITGIIKKLQTDYPKDAVVITGHSLGGSFAEVAGALNKIPAVGISAPGQFYLMKSFGLDRQSITKNVVTIMPSLDPVPVLAEHIDMVQRISCVNSDGTRRSGLDLPCHSSENTFCELWRACGDVEGRETYCVGRGLVRKECKGHDIGDDKCVKLGV